MFLCARLLRAGHLSVICLFSGKKNLILKLLKDGLNLSNLIPEFCWKAGVWEAFMQILQIKTYLAILFTLWGVWAAHLPNIVRPHLQASVSVLLLIPRSPTGLLELGKEQLIVPKPHSQHACCFPVFLDNGKTWPSKCYNGSPSFTVGFLTPSAGRQLKKDVFLCEFPCLSSISISKFFFLAFKNFFWNHTHMLIVTGILFLMLPQGYDNSDAWYFCSVGNWTQGLILWVLKYKHSYA